MGTVRIVALSLENAEAWAKIILAIGAILPGIIAAWWARQAKQNAAVAASAAVGAAHVAADKAQTTDLKLTEIHEKADHAITQNDQLVAQTDGHYTELMKLLNALVETIKQKPAVVALPRQVREEDLKRSKAEGPEQK